LQQEEAYRSAYRSTWEAKKVVREPLRKREPNTEYSWSMVTVTSCSVMGREMGVVLLRESPKTDN
jgi:hypothetical protein